MPHDITSDGAKIKGPFGPSNFALFKIKGAFEAPFGLLSHLFKAWPKIVLVTASTPFTPFSETKLYPRAGLNVFHLRFFTFEFLTDRPTLANQPFSLAFSIQRPRAGQPEEVLREV